jgi:tetratricopeptide (TPR) repeat protein
LLAAATVIALVASSGGGDSAGDSGRRAKGEGGERVSAAGGAGSSRPTDSSEAAGASESEAAGGPEVAPLSDVSAPDPARGAALNEEGFALIQAGEYEAAVPILEEATSSFPEGSESLDYAYALFNLGNALRLSGRPEEAIPILERRLQIPDQEGEVRKELEAAYAEAGEPTTLEE